MGIFIVKEQATEDEDISHTPNTWVAGLGDVLKLHLLGDILNWETVVSNLIIQVN